MSEEFPLTHYSKHPRLMLNKWGHICFTTIHCFVCNSAKSAIGCKFIQGEKFGRMICRECREKK